MAITVYAAKCVYTIDKHQSTTNDNYISQIIINELSRTNTHYVNANNCKRAAIFTEWKCLTDKMRNVQAKSTVRFYMHIQVVKHNTLCKILAVDV